MIIKGGSRKSAGFFSVHLMKAEDNERVEIKEMRGLYANDLKEAFREMRLIAAGTRAENYFYHASINPREDEHLTPEQWNIAVDRLESNLNLDGHARVQIEHEKEGRTHRHIVWSRIDPDTMTATPDSHNYLAHDKTRQELEQEFNHEPTPPTPQPSQRKSREFAEWENFRAQESKIDPREMKAEVTALWQHSDSGAAFQSALEDKGYILCKGDRRDFCIIDNFGDVHSLGRRVEGLKTADIRARLTDIDRDSLMTVKEASAWVKAQDTAENGDSTEARIASQEAGGSEEAPPFLNPKLRVLEKYAHDHPAIAPPEGGGYITPTTAQEFAALQKTLLPASGWQLPYFGNQTAQEWQQQHAWHTLEARRADLPAPEPEPVQDAHDELWEEWVSRPHEKEKEPER